MALMMEVSAWKTSKSTICVAESVSLAATLFAIYTLLLILLFFLSSASLFYSTFVPLFSPSPYISPYISPIYLSIYLSIITSPRLPLSYTLVWSICQATCILASSNQNIFRFCFCFFRDGFLPPTFPTTLLYFLLHYYLLHCSSKKKKKKIN